MTDTKKNFYVNQLTKQDILELFARIQLFVEYQGKTVAADFAIQTPNGRFKLDNSKPYSTLFLKNFSCSLSGATPETKANVRRIYRDFMLEKFEGTDYAVDAQAYDLKQAEKAAKQTI